MELSRCHSCDAEVPAGTDLCAECRTEPLPRSDLAGPREPPGEAAPLVGRDEVLRQLAALALEAARNREPRFCLVVGNAGVGKSRLLRELALMLAARANPPLRVLSGSCGPGAQPYAPFAAQLRQRFEIDAREALPAAQDKLLRGCRSLLTGVRATEVAHLLAELLRIPFADSPVVGPPGPHNRLEPRIYLALKRLLSADAARGPLALLFDEVEHASAEAMKLLHYLAAGLSGAPVLLCAFARPDIDDVHGNFLAWGRGEAACERIELLPLSPPESVALLRGRAGAEVPAPVARHVERHLAGSPRAVLELGKLLEETGVLRAEAAGPAWDRLRALTLPTDMEGLVLARLQVMDPAQRDVLEKAATCGEHFFLDAVVALLRATEVGLGMLPVRRPDAGAEYAEASGPVLATDPDGPTLEEIVVGGDRATHAVGEALKELTRRGLVLPLPDSAICGESEYRFAYPPLREVIYDGIPPRRRRRYHGLLSQWLDLSPEGQGAGEDTQEAIGRHLERAGQGDAAAHRYRRAAELARDRYAHARATRLYARAIACLGTADLAARIRLWHELGAVFHEKGDYDNALQAYEKVVRLSWVMASRSKAALALLHMGQLWRQKGELQLALDYLLRALELFQQAEDQAGVADTEDDIGQVLWLLGRYDEALDRSAAALETRRQRGDRRKVAASLLNIGNIERHRGLFEEAEACYREALSIRRADGDKGGIGACLNAIGMLAFQRGDLPAARRSWEEALLLAEQVGATPLQVAVLCHLGEVLLLQGTLAEAQAQFRTAKGLARELSDKRLLSESTRSLGLVALRMGDPKEALGQCEAALRLAEEAGVRVDVGRALLALGEVHAATLFDAEARGEVPALDYYRRGVELFREIGNNAELAVGLSRTGRYLVERGEIEEGRALLTEAEGIFARLKVRAREDVLQMLSEI